MTSATNPENGPVSYTYDGNGNMLTRSDARGVVATMDYDAADRPMSKTYSGDPTNTPAVRYCYDGRTYVAASGTCNGSAVQGKRMQLTAVGSSVSLTQHLEFDALGRIKTSSQATGSSGPHTFGYTYRLDGSLSSMTYPSGRIVNYEHDTAGRVSSIPGYLTSLNYAEHGALSRIVYGNSFAEQICFNARLQPIRITVKSGLAATCVANGTDIAGADLDLRFSYGASNNNGNVLNQTIAAPLTAGGVLKLQQVYAYDALNRLSNVSESVVSGATGGAWQRGFDADARGNMWVTSSTQAPHAAVPTAGNQFDAATNRLTKTAANATISYDAAGFQTQHPAVGTMTYDAEGRLLTATGTGVTATYSYDGNGRRVKKDLGGGQVVTYVYDAGGDLAAEYGGAAQASEAGRRYRSEDHLGSTRLEMDTAGVTRRHDYFPFGEELVSADYNGRRDLVTGYPGSSGAFPQKFTGKERDAETGLDYFGARYYGGDLGRFTSPDAPFADQHPENPQSWNLYQYGYNNPLANVDLDGRSVWSKAVKVVFKTVKTGNAAAGFADNVQDVGTLLSPAASPLQKLGAGLSLASELLPVSVGDVKDAGRLLGLVDDAVDAGKQVARKADDVADAGKKVEGIYEFSDSGKTYVGQSSNVPGRIGQHLESGKLAPGSTVTVTPVPGGKTAREVAEQKRINQLGGTANKPGSQTTNQRNPIGPKRQKRVEDEYGPLDQN